MHTPSTSKAIARSRPLRISETERGQNLVEFALLTPFVIIFIGAIVVFGIALNTRSSLQQGVREGARQAAVGASLAEVQNIAAGNAREVIDPADVAWCHPPGPTSPATQGRIGDPVRVYIYKDGAEGYPYEVAPSGGVLTMFGFSRPAIRMSPIATARLETSVSAGSIVNCPP